MTTKEEMQFTSKAYECINVEEKTYGFIVSITTEDLANLMKEAHLTKENELFVKLFLEKLPLTMLYRKSEVEDELFARMNFVRTILNFIYFIEEVSVGEPVVDYSKL